MWKRFNKNKTEETRFLQYHIIDKKFTLSQQIVMLITLVVFIALLPASIFTTQRVAKVIYDRVSINAVSINNILCNSKEIKDSLILQNIHVDPEVDKHIEAYVNDVDNSDEAGVAVYDRNLRLRVLYNPGNLRNFAESAYDLVLKYSKMEEISWQENYSIPNKAFGYVKDGNNQVIGYVVTGYSDDIFNKSTMDSILFLLNASLISLLFGILGAIFLAGKIKKVLFGYEPEEIAALLQERNIILNSVREGVININGDGVITLVNSEAQLLLRQAGIERSEELTGKRACEVLKNIRTEEVFREGRTAIDASVKIGNTVFIYTIVPLKLNSSVIGAVLTFRQKSAVEEMANQLTGFKNYAAALRAQTHEFMNKMHVIMGLIDMKAYDELKKYTEQIASDRQSEVSYVISRMKDITLAGFILGKISRSRELDISFSLSEESELHTALDVPSVHDIVLIAGNLIENAFDALKNYPGERIVNLSILDFDCELVITVEDSGPGISEEMRRNMFRQGCTSKGRGHGYGLFLVQKSIENLNGSITVESVPGEGTVFTVRLPLKKDGE